MARKADERINRNIRLSGFEWECFKDLLGAEWLRDQIHQAAKAAGRKPPKEQTK
jgi:hypothetical protein